jgi:hypothetical protein
MSIDSFVGQLIFEQMLHPFGFTSYERKFGKSLSKDEGRKILEPCFREIFFDPHFSTASIVLDTECLLGVHSALDVDSSQQAVSANFSPSEAVWKHRGTEDTETKRPRTPSSLCDLCASVF